jgi:hypothetical protein
MPMQILNIIFSNIHKKQQPWEYDLSTHETTV